MRITQNKKSPQKLLLVTGIILFALLATLAFWYYQKKLADQRQQQYGSSSTTPTENIPKPNKDTSTSTSGGSISSSKEQTDATPPSIDQTVAPQTPVGTFVSNHHPNLSGSPAPNLMNSACRTTPGATCTISFTNGSETLALPEKITDINGNASWSWKLQDIGLSEGSWTITAIAKNGAKTATATDATRLDVKP